MNRFNRPSRGGKDRWRRERDSNPRYGFCPYNALAGRPLRPLGHHSGGTQIVLGIPPERPSSASSSGLLVHARLLVAALLRRAALDVAARDVGLDVFLALV